MKQLYKANGKVYMFVEYSDGLYGDCTKCDLFKVDDKTCIEAPCGGGYFVENKEEKIMNNVNKHINKPHIHAEVIKAWADGAEIEYYTTFDNKWSIATTPAWKRDTQYRVKLEPSYPKTRLTGGGKLHEVWYDIEEYTEYTDFVELANHVIKEFIVSGQMDEYIKERNN